MVFQRRGQMSVSTVIVICRWTPPGWAGVKPGLRYRLRNIIIISLRLSRILSPHNEMYCLICVFRLFCVFTGVRREQTLSLQGFLFHWVSILLAFCSLCSDSSRGVLWVKSLTKLKNDPLKPRQGNFVSAFRELKIGLNESQITFYLHFHRSQTISTILALLLSLLLSILVKDESVPKCLQISSCHLYQMMETKHDKQQQYIKWRPQPVCLMFWYLNNSSH